MLGSCNSAPSLMLVIGRNPSSQSCCCKAFLNHILERFEDQLLSDQLLFWHCFHTPAHWAWKISPPSVFRQVLLFQSMLLLTKYCQVFKVVSNCLFPSPSFASEGTNCLQTLEPPCFWVSLDPQFSFVIGFVSPLPFFLLSIGLEILKVQHSSGYYLFSLAFPNVTCHAGLKMNGKRMNENVLNLEDLD